MSPDAGSYECRHTQPVSFVSRCERNRRRRGRGAHAMDVVVRRDERVEVAGDRQRRRRAPAPRRSPHSLLVLRAVVPPTSPRRDGRAPASPRRTERRVRRTTASRPRRVRAATGRFRRPSCFPLPARERLRQPLRVSEERLECGLDRRARLLGGRRPRDRRLDIRDERPDDRSVEHELNGHVQTLR